MNLVEIKNKLWYIYNSYRNYINIVMEYSLRIERKDKKQRAK